MLKRRFIRIILYILAGLLVLILSLYTYYRVSTHISEPEIPASQVVPMERFTTGPDSYRCEYGWLKKSREGWWEMYLEGSPYQVGYAHGLLTKELIDAQEKAFISRLGEMIPSRFYQEFMLAFVRFFNRGLEEYVLPEYRQEIFGISRFASPDFDFIGPAYARMLNYHAAHDIGHSMQNMNLVACTAFGAWDARSADSSLIIGRNFDFFVSDDFAKEKILCFIKPDSGYSFVMVTWASFAGVISGMNEKGLTVTLNAAKSAIPFGARTPVSLLGREILQYASNIDEAFAIAKKRETFVAESFLIGSAADHKAVVIEKSPEKTAIYDPAMDYIVVTNHFQSDSFLTEPLNMENKANETSVYRYNRMKELLASNPPVDPVLAAKVLRDYKGMNDKDIGLGNEKAVNQFIAHHSIIFKPEKLQFWVAGPPYQLGEYRGYDLDSVFTPLDPIAADTLPLTTVYPVLQKYRSLAAQVQSGKFPASAADSLIRYNPEFFLTYRILGDYFKKQGNKQRAAEYYKVALEKEAPSAAEKNSVNKLLQNF